MDLKTAEVLKIINFHLKIKKILTILSYFLIIGGIFIYAFHGFSRSRNIKLITQYREEAKNYKAEKIMTNPRLKFQYDDAEIYDIQAKKAFHKDEKEMTMYDVFATGKTGNITAGELNIYDEGNHLVFTKNPVLILNESK
jgi:hypothetical protein